MPLTVDVVSPERVLYTGEADMLVCRTTDGEIAFLPGHAPFLGALGIGVVRSLLPESGEQAVAVHGGFVGRPTARGTVRPELADPPEQTAVERARRAKERAEERLAADPDDEEAQAALLRAETRLEVAGAIERT